MELIRRKAINLILFSLILRAFPLFAQTPSPVPVKSLTYQDFAHPNKGCPENSDCDEVMGKLLEKWKKLAERWETSLPRSIKEKEMQTQLAQLGWPVEFYVKSQAKSGLNPILFSSQCSLHNPKDKPTDRIWRGQAFVKGTEKDMILFSRGDTEFKIKQGELLHLRPVVIFEADQAPKKYFLPIHESPVYLQKEKLHVVVESEGVYAMLAIPTEGLWEVHLTPESGLGTYFDDKSDVKCPKEALAPEAPWFQHTHCEKIMNKDTGKMVIAQYFSACEG